VETVWGEFLIRLDDKKWLSRYPGHSDKGREPRYAWQVAIAFCDVIR